MANLLDIDLLRAFVAVVETGSFSRAGERIGRSQSAVSMQIKRLEQSIGKRLLGVSLDIENYCTIRASPACQRRCLWFLSALQ
ncbi:LysR family transcriptional regulator [Klebsiella michiganensis]|uniref:LysR family transcriptional regulator n=1 Tax=Klebsiella michiganensis TaxID=1134687 RepID=UPI003B97E986